MFQFGWYIATISLLSLPPHLPIPAPFSVVSRGLQNSLTVLDVAAASGNGDSALVCEVLSKHMQKLTAATPYVSAMTCVLIKLHITRYGSTLYIGIAMVFVFSPYIRKFSSYFHFQVIVTFNDFIALNV